MKLIVAFWLIAATAAAPPILQIIIPDDKPQLPVYENKIDADGSYSFRYALSDGQKRKEEGHVKNAGLENQTMVVTGSYQWIGPDGELYEVIYVADENGYQVETQHKVVQASVTPQIASMLG